jgi:hypothetical protein
MHGLAVTIPTVWSPRMMNGPRNQNKCDQISKHYRLTFDTTLFNLALYERLNLALCIIVCTSLFLRTFMKRVIYL